MKPLVAPLLLSGQGLHIAVWHIRPSVTWSPCWLTMSPWTRPPEDAGKDNLVTWNVILRLILYTCLILTLRMSRITQVEGIVRNPACRPLFLGRKHLNYSRKRAGLVSMTSPFPGSDFKGVFLPHSVLDKEQKYPTGNYAHLKLTLMIGLRNSLNPVAVFHIGIECKANS